MHKQSMYQILLSAKLHLHNRGFVSNDTNRHTLLQIYKTPYAGQTSSLIKLYLDLNFESLVKCSGQNLLHCFLNLTGLLGRRIMSKSIPSSFCLLPRCLLLNSLQMKSNNTHQITRNTNNQQQVVNVTAILDILVQS